MIREHEVPEGSDRCKHCHAFKPGPESTCIVRDGGAAEKPRPEPARRVMACEDDSIAERIAELRREREKAWNEGPTGLLLRPRGLPWFSVTWVYVTDDKEAPVPPPPLYKAGQPQ